jgi:hypothetical protein
MPMEILGLEIENEYVGKQCGERSRNARYGPRRDIGRRCQRRPLISEVLEMICPFAGWQLLSNFTPSDCLIPGPHEWISTRTSGRPQNLKRGESFRGHTRGRSYTLHRLQQRSSARLRMYRVSSNHAGIRAKPESSWSPERPLLPCGEEPVHGLRGSGLRTHRQPRRPRSRLSVQPRN